MLGGGDHFFDAATGGSLLGSNVSLAGFGN